MFVKPVEGRQVPDPERGGALLPAEGRNVTPSQYWFARQEDGDITVNEPDFKPAKKKD